MRASTLILCALGMAHVAHAAQVRGTATTILAGREDARAGEEVQVMPLYELLALEVAELDLLGEADGRMVLQGWGRLAQDEVVDNGADLGLLFLESQTRRLTLRAGRQHIVAGAGRMHMVDGGSVDVHLPAGVTVQAYGGTTVIPEMRVRGDTWQAGGRAAARLFDRGEVGLGYRREHDRLGLRHQELALDTWWLVGSTRLLGLVSVDPAQQALIEGRVAATFAAAHAVDVTLDAERSVPSLLLPQTSIFSVFAQSAHDALGGDVQWTPSPYYSLSVAGHGLRTKDSALGYRAAVRAVTYREPSHLSSIGSEVQRVAEDDNAYTSLRLFTTLQLCEALRVSGDVFLYQYDEAINDISAAYLAQGSVLHDLTESLRVAATLSAGATPYAESQLGALVRLVYGYDGVHFASEGLR